MSKDKWKTYLENLQRKLDEAKSNEDTFALANSAQIGLLVELSKATEIILENQTTLHENQKTIFSQMESDRKRVDKLIELLSNKITIEAH